MVGSARRVVRIAAMQFFRFISVLIPGFRVLEIVVDRRARRAILPDRR
jgi:hypothetical protein